MTNFQVSVVVPTYNRCDSLEVMLSGLMRQDFEGAWELIVVSDGSTDGTARRMKKFALSAPFPIRFVAQENAGPARARNRGVSMSRGEVVLFLDDDVEPTASFVSRHAAGHADASDIAVIGPMLPDPDRRSSEPVWTGWEHAMLQKQYDAWAAGVWKGAGAHHFYSGNASVRREHLEAVGGFNEAFGRQEDVELAVRLEKECGIRFRYDAQAVGIHRPVRSFEGWLKIPFAYGSLDITRAQADGGRTWERVRHGYRDRNRATRFIADLCLSAPFVSAPIRATLLAGAKVAYNSGKDPAAFALLSALYNVRYLEGAAKAIGGGDALRHTLFPARAYEVTNAQAREQQSVEVF
ncbi:MAG: glycosyltransferase family 2 protein [Akkermansiaceae bacterium]|nr:glycosyltransferase family 2 protein [Armatimonadota bacterium]